MEMTKEELLAALAKMDEEQPEAAPEPPTVEVRGVRIALDPKRVTSWSLTRKLADMQRQVEGGADYTTLVLWMDIITEACGLTEEQVLDMAGGHYADVAEVADVLNEITRAVFPKKS